MSLLLLLFSSALATGWHLRAAAPRQALRIVGASVGVITLVIIFGVARLTPPTPAVSVKVGLIAWDRSVESPMTTEGAPTAQLLQAYADQTTALAAQRRAHHRAASWVHLAFDPTRKQSKDVVPLLIVPDAQVIERSVAHFVGWDSAGFVLRRRGLCVLACAVSAEGFEHQSSEEWLRSLALRDSAAVSTVTP